MTLELIILAAIMIFIGIIILALIIKSLFYFLPAIVIALGVLLITGSIFYAGVAFLVIAVLMVILRR